MTRRETSVAAEPDALSNDNLPAAFWDANPEDDSNPDLLAIKALQEESTPQERADNLKVQANELFKRGVQLKKKYFVQQAVAKYGEAIELLDREPEGEELRINVLSNRAQAHLRLGNNRTALSDALAALSLDEGNLKAAFRGATAASRLEDFGTAGQLCCQGLRSNPEAADLLKLQEAVQARARAVKEAKEREAARQLSARAPAKRLALALTKRGWQIGAPQMSSAGNRKPFLDESGTAHWPVLFIYPEVMQNDAVEDVAESDTFEEHLDEMFGPGSPPLQWDSEGSYSRSRLELYYISHSATPLSLSQLTEALHSGWPSGVLEQEPERYGEKAARAVRVDEAATLADILARPDHVIPGLPVFFVVATGTEYRTRFLDGFA